MPHRPNSPTMMFVFCLLGLMAYKGSGFDHKTGASVYA
jgi:hypothetical protein